MKFPHYANISKNCQKLATLYTHLAWIFTASSSALACHSFSAESRSDWASANFNLKSDNWFRRSDLSPVSPSMATVNSPRTACLTSSRSASNFAFVWNGWKVLNLPWNQLLTLVKMFTMKFRNFHTVHCFHVENSTDLANVQFSHCKLHTVSYTLQTSPPQCGLFICIKSPYWGEEVCTNVDLVHAWVGVCRIPLVYFTNAPEKHTETITFFILKFN